MVIMSVLAVSCTPVGNVDYSGIRSVGFSNGMGDKLKRVRIGTTVFNNSSETVNVPGISPKVTEAADTARECEACGEAGRADVSGEVQPDGAALTGDQCGGIPCEID